MKNKSGFTLVELLAVIAILSILVIIALPNIMGLFNEAKQNAFETELKNVYKSAQQTWMSDSLFNTNEQIYSNCDGCTGKKLKLSGREQLNYYIKISKSGKIVEYCSTDNTNQYYYEGTGLDIESIGSVESVSKTSEDMQIIITPNGCERKGLGRQITVCYFTSADSSIADGVINTLNCNSKQTISECFSGVSITPFYLYTNNLSNPGPVPEFDACRANLNEYSQHIDIHNCYIKAPNFQDCINKVALQFTTDGALEKGYAVCTYNDDFYQRVTSIYTTTVLPQTSGCYAQVKYDICLDGESEVEVYDKKKKKKLKKKLKDVTYDDLILCWDFKKGKYTYAKPLWIMKPHDVDEYIELTFSDGSKLNVMGDHRIFNLDTNKFTSCLKAKESPIGMNTINSKGEVIQLVKRRIVKERNTAYNVIIDKHINLYANGLLTSRGLNNLYPIENMKFVHEDREVFRREELNEIPDEYFYGLNLGETPRTFMGNEERTKEQLLMFIKRTIDTKK